MGKWLASHSVEPGGVTQAFIPAFIFTVSFDKAPERQGPNYE